MSRPAVISEETLLEGAVFEIRVESALGVSTAYASDAENAYAAFWQLRRDANIQGKKIVTVRNLVSGEVPYYATVN